jgi:Xaa-Pro dipeptidase
MPLTRRRFLQSGALGAGALAAGCAASPESTKPTADTPDFLKGLSPMTAGVVPIGDDERRGRIAKAQRLMEEQKLDAIFMEGTASCFYFANMRWGLSERTFGVVIPAKGDLAYVCPGFEEDRARELITFGTDVRVWQEDESPFKLIADIVKDRGVRHGRIGIEERVRFFIADGIRKASTFELADATPVTAGCRMYKSANEIALMQRANDVTIEAYKAAFKTLKPGMTQGELGANITAAFKALGYTGSAGTQFGIYTAFPHGSATPQTLKEGDIVMVDGGTSCEGYASDITRTTVMGTPTPRQTEIWNLERKAQDAGFAAAQIGAPCENVDIAARKVIVDAGFGPGYKVPGLPHRTGHGIGLEGHEWTNFVLGNKTPLAPGMCFSDEPTVVIYGEFGIRLEDCLYMTENGPKFFTKQSISITEPFG